MPPFRLRLAVRLAAWRLPFSNNRALSEPSPSPTGINSPLKV
ncbi:CRISPR-associated protein Cas5 [Deinococcus sp. Marseille-Q6407]